MIKIILTLLIFSTHVSADGIVAFNDPLEFSQCTTKNGKPVHTSYVDEPIKQAADYAAAWKYKEKHPTYYYIHLNYGIFHDAPTHAREWVWYHECGHQKLGHTLDKNRYAESTSSIIKAEGEADCFAAREFRRHHQESELYSALQWAKSTMGTNDLRIKRIMECKHEEISSSSSDGVSDDRRVRWQGRYER